MKFLNPEVVFDGVIQIDGNITQPSHAVTKSYLESNSVVAIHSDSSQYAEIVTDGGQKKLKIKPLTIGRTLVDTTQTSLANWLAANYSNGNEYQESDIIILTNVSGSTRPDTFIHNGGTAGSAADWTEIQGADVQAAEVRAFLSASAGVNYDASTGAITADQSEIRGFFSAGSGLSYSAGAFSLNASTDLVNEGSNLYFTEARSRNAISVVDTSELDLTYNAGTGVLKGDLKDGSVANARLVNSAITIAGASTALGGSITAAAILGASDTDSLPEGSSSLYFTNARAQAAITVQDSSELDLSISSGQISAALKPGSVANARLVNSAITIAGASTALGGSITAAAILGASDTDSLPEGSSSLYHTAARVRASIQADAAADNLLEFMSLSGDIKVSLSKLRKEFSSEALSAGTFKTLNHALGKRLVHVSAMDSSGNIVQLEVQFQDANNVKVKANSNVTVDIAVSL